MISRFTVGPATTLSTVLTIGHIFCSLTFREVDKNIL
jgi:hypothetical protein